MSKTVIIFDANPLIGNKTGVGYLTYSLLESLAQNEDIRLVGHYFNFLNKRDDSGLHDLENIEFIKSTLFPTKLVNILRRLKIELPLELFTRKKADVHLFTNFTSFPSLFKTKNFLFVHDMGFIDAPEYVSEANKKYLTRYVPKSIKRAHTIFTISHFTKKRIIEIYGYKKDIVVMPVPPASPPKSTDKVEYSFELPNRFMLFIGTIEPRKNLSVLLKSFSRIYENTGVGLVLAGGKGWKDTEILESIEAMKSKDIPIIQTGYITDEQKADLYRRAALYIQPSLYEGFGMPVLEAMSFGTPVLCSDIEVFHEIAGSAVKYFPANDPTKLSSIAIKLLQDSVILKSMGSSSAKKFEEYPDWVAASRVVSSRF